METFTSNLVISDVVIGENKAGLYSANDLHKASGGLEKHKPKFFLENARTQRFLGILEETSAWDSEGGIPPSLQTVHGVGGGTFMCRELLTQYASWLSPEIDLAVTRAFIEKVERDSQTRKQPDLQLACGDFEALKRVAELTGLDSNESCLRANLAVKKLCGLDVLTMLGQTHLLILTQEVSLTAKDIAIRIGVKALDTNKLITKAGLQSNHWDRKDRLYYQVTEAGKPYAKLLDTGKARGNGTSIIQVEWYESVLPLLKNVSL